MIAMARIAKQQCTGSRASRMLHHFLPLLRDDHRKLLRPLGLLQRKLLHRAIRYLPLLRDEHLPLQRKLLHRKLLQRADTCSPPVHL